MSRGDVDYEPGHLPTTYRLEVSTHRIDMPVPVEWSSGLDYVPETLDELTQAPPA